MVEANLWSVILIALAVGLISPFPIRILLGRLGIVDVPSDRSSHSSAVIRGAGLAPLAAILIALASALALDMEEAFLITSFGGLLLCAGIIGWSEDYKGLSITVRAYSQIALGTSYGIALSWYFGAPWYLLFPVSIAIASYINFANFMDGINGISSLHGFVAGVSFSIMGWQYSWTWPIVCGAVIAASFIAFLPWNFNGRLFLGDVGSYTLGAAVAGLSAALFFNGASLFAAISPMIIYVVDTCTTLFRRILRGDKWYESHREHVYQQLTPRYFTHLQAALLVAVFSSTVSFLAIISVREGSRIGTGMLTTAVVVAVVYLWTPRLSAQLEGLRRNHG